MAAEVLRMCANSHPHVAYKEGECPLCQALDKVAELEDKCLWLEHKVQTFREALEAN